MKSLCIPLALLCSCVAAPATDSTKQVRPSNAANCCDDPGDCPPACCEVAEAAPATGAAAACCTVATR